MKMYLFHVIPILYNTVLNGILQFHETTMLLQTCKWERKIGEGETHLRLGSDESVALKGARH